MTPRTYALLLFVVAGFLPALSATAAVADRAVTVLRYEVRGRGHTSDLEEFAAAAAGPTPRDRRKPLFVRRVEDDRRPLLVSAPLVCGARVPG